ncbi:MAG: hypothetical protein GTN36_03990 [Candidatus Aenigmarchaeota archaeon]|nr:hypothetical protein [Candidatus Aenigmarchaeota archaeon]
MKGQTAVEYLMTYGWAILIILIVAGVLAYYGIFAPAGFLGPTARGFGQVQVLNPWAVSTAGVVTLNLANRVGGAINITQAVLTIDATDYTCTPTVELEIASGEDDTFTCTSAPTPITGADTGESYSATTVISYRYPSDAATADFSTSGTITGTYS